MPRCTGSELLLSAAQGITTLTANAGACTIDALNHGATVLECAVTSGFPENLRITSAVDYRLSSEFFFRAS